MDEATTDPSPAVFVQWKGTEVCLDFQCSCSDPEDAYEFHFDGFMFGVVKCPRCARTWGIDCHPTVRPSGRADGALLVADD